MAFKFKGLRALRMFNNGRIVGGHHYVFKAKMYIVTKKKFHKISQKGMIQRLIYQEEKCYFIFITQLQRLLNNVTIFENSRAKNFKESVLKFSESDYTN